MKRWGIVLLSAVAVALTLAVPQVGAQTAGAPAAAADAYGLDVDVTLVGNIAVDHGPFARATQEAPPEEEDPATANVVNTGQIPAGGTVVENIGVLTATAEATEEPRATATAQAVDVQLLMQGGTPLITAEVLRAQSNSDCEDDPNAAGTEFVNVRVATFADPIPTPEPNTRLLPTFFNPLGIEVVLNEQHPTADGRGFVVNAIHVYQLQGQVPSLFTGDLVVAHAMSTVNCPDGPGSTGDENDVVIVKEVDQATAVRGDTLTYTATVTNNSDVDCLVNRFVDHLPSAFEFESTAGDFGDVATTEARPGGGVDVIIQPAAMVIEDGASATQTFTVTVADDAEPGTYFNNVELFCGNLGNWVKGLDAPVEVVAEVTPTTTTSTTEPARELDELAATGDSALLPVGGLAVLAGGMLLALRRRLA